MTGGVWLLLCVGLAAGPERPAVPRHPQEKSKTLLRKSGDAPAPRKSAPADADDKAPPVVPPRPIPGPDDRPPQSDLDRDLLRELARDLENAEPADQEDPLLRAGKRMRTVEERLARLDSSDETIDLQQRIVQDLEQLLQQMQQQQQGEQGKRQRTRQRQEKPSPQPKQQQPAVAQKSSDSSPHARSGRTTRQDASKGPEVRDVWGHLSDLLRDEMNQYLKEDFLPAYRDLLEKYYSTIASQSQSRSK